jgi:hypothetical protein
VCKRANCFGRIDQKLAGTVERHKKIVFSQAVENMVRPEGFEPPTLCLEADRPLCQILPEEALPARFQQVRAILRNPLSPSFSPILLPFAVVFRNLRYVFVTVLSHITTNSSGPLICNVPGFFNSLAGTLLAALPELVRIVLTYPTLQCEQTRNFWSVGLQSFEPAIFHPAVEGHFHRL